MFNSNSNDIFGLILQCMLIGLKLTGHINWPWIWVLSPIWIGFLIVGLIIFIGILIDILNG